MDIKEEIKENSHLVDLIEKVNNSEIASIKSIVSGVIDIINDPRANVKDLKELIEIDPPLTAKVLRTANSAYYASKQKISEIEKAVIWIGFEALKEIALNQKVCEIFDGDKQIQGYSGNSLWKHSVAAALISKLIYRREFGENGGTIYAAGLLHDIGLIVEDQFLHNDFKNIIYSSKKNNRDLHIIENEILGYDHSDIGGMLTQTWEFPAEFSSTLELHHFPVKKDGIISKMAHTLYIADYLCYENEIGFCDVVSPDENIFAQCVNDLEIDNFSLKLIMKAAAEELKKMEDKGFFDNE